MTLLRALAAFEGSSEVSGGHWLLISPDPEVAPPLRSISSDCFRIWLSVSQWFTKFFIRTDTECITTGAACIRGGETF